MIGMFDCSSRFAWNVGVLVGKLGMGSRVVAPDGPEDESSCRIEESGVALSLVDYMEERNV